MESGRRKWPVEFGPLGYGASELRSVHDGVPIGERHLVLRHVIVRSLRKTVAVTRIERYTRAQPIGLPG